MLIVLLDEPGLFVFESTASAERQIEAIDAESALRAAFDETGIPYRVQWLRPNRRGLLGSIRPGQYRFVPAGPADRSALIALLEQHPDHTQPPEARATLASLLAARRGG